MSNEIRKATEADRTEMTSIIRSLDLPQFQVSNPEYVQELMEKKERYVAVHKKRITGTIILKRSAESCEIHILATKERRKGVGRALVEYAIEKCKKQHIPKIWCWSLSCYHAEGFYKKMGFEESFLLRKHFFGEDCYLLGKVIDNEK